MWVGERGREVRVAWQVGVERVVVWGSGWVRVGVGWEGVVVVEGSSGRVVEGGGGAAVDGVVVVGGFEGEVMEGRSIGALVAMLGGGCGCGVEVEDVMRGCDMSRGEWRWGWFMRGGSRRG